MYTNNLKIAVRNLLKNRSNTIISLLGLVVGFTSLILIAFWIRYQLSYDQFHKKAERTYRVAYKGVLMGKEIEDAMTSETFYYAFGSEFPEVESATILSNFNEALLKKEDGEAFRVKLSGVNPDFFDVFSVPVIRGDINQLSNPNTAVITPEMAKIFFGDEDPVGKVISTGMDHGTKKFTIVGLVEKLPENSHLEYDMLYSNTSQSWYRNQSNNWLNASFYNYVVLKPGINFRKFEEKLNNYALERIAYIIKDWKGISMDEWYGTGDFVRFELQPLTKIHLYSSLEDEYKQNGNILYIYIFLGVGILILVISIINFSNLSLVSSFGRTKEIGIRKVSGSSRKSLVVQYLFESCLLSSVALLISIFIVALIAPYFENLTGVTIWSHHNFKWWILSGLVLLALISGILSGLFPATVLSKMNPVKAFATTKNMKFQGFQIRDVLIVAQFVISIAVIVGTIIITNQLNFLQNENLGFNKENILVIKGTEDLSHQTNVLLNERIQKLSYVHSSTSSNYLPNGHVDFFAIVYPISNRIESGIISFLPCDHNFKDVYQFKIIEGQFFEREFSGESRKIVLNETAVKSLGLEDCIGRVIIREGVEYEIIGIVNDFHFSSKQTKIGALGFVQVPDAVEFWPPLYCSVLIDGNYSQTAVNDIKKIWKEIVPGNEFSYSFFDQEYEQLYRNEMQTKTVFSIFSVIAILLSCTGLFGFVKYAIQVRTKEIGVRKVNGARSSSIFILLSGYFTRPILIALVIACPLSWLAIGRWLQNFAYHIDISAISFVLAGFPTVLIVFVTVGWLSWRAANRNPVEALRYE